MKVSELIEELSKKDPAAQVFKLDENHRGSAVRRVEVTRDGDVILE